MRLKPGLLAIVQYSRPDSGDRASRLRGRPRANTRRIGDHVLILHDPPDVRQAREDQHKERHRQCQLNQPMSSLSS